VGHCHRRSGKCFTSTSLDTDDHRSSLGDDGIEFWFKRVFGRNLTSYLTVDDPSIIRRLGTFMTIKTIHLTHSQKKNRSHGMHKRSHQRIKRKSSNK
jgi:hypothetical protein